MAKGNEERNLKLKPKTRTKKRRKMRLNSASAKARPWSPSSREFHLRQVVGWF
jgi:hypothetical protein